MEFYDLDYATVAALKGGVGNASGWTPSNTFVNIELALSIEMDSGQVIDFYNASCDTTLNFAGGRDTMGSMKMVAMPQLTADGDRNLSRRIKMYWGHKAPLYYKVCGKKKIKRMEKKG